MSESNKVLSVSYGTFSCTLEGFDDSVETMKAVAAYFRDLAAEDREFGVDQWEPNPETLARIAEGEYDRRVDATVTDGEIVLSTGAALDQTDEDEDDTGGNRIANRLRRIRDVAAAGAAVAESTDDDTIKGDEEPVTVAVVDTLEEDLAAAETILEPEEDLGLEEELDETETLEELTEEDDEDDVEEVLWPEKAEDEDLADEDEAVEEDVALDPEDEIEDLSDLEDVAALDGVETDEIAEEASAPEDDASDEPEAEPEDEPAEEAEFPVSPLRARIIKLRRSDVSASDEETPEAASTDDTAPEAEDSDALAAQAEGETLEDEDDFETTSGSEDVFVLTNAADTEVEDEEEHEEADDDLEETLEDDTPEDDPSEDDSKEDAGVAGARFAARLSKRHQFETDVSHDDQDMERILDQTNAQLEEPESRNRRSAIAQLKAAVAATVAEREGSDGTEGGDDPENAYREDLSEAVKARGPEAGRPAPLKLVPSQRVGDEDETEVPAAASNANAQSFAEFARAVDAQDLPELLEAAAAHTAFVEGKAQFSRPQIIRKINEISGEDFTREDSLRHFGKLLRDGRIRKSSGGQFEVTEDTRFRPDDEDMGVA